MISRKFFTVSCNETGTEAILDESVAKLCCAANTQRPSDFLRQTSGVYSSFPGIYCKSVMLPHAPERMLASNSLQGCGLTFVAALQFHSTR